MSISQGMAFGPEAFSVYPREWRSGRRLLVSISQGMALGLLSNMRQWAEVSGFREAPKLRLKPRKGPKVSSFRGPNPRF